MKILLDTHIVIWVLENNQTLSPYYKSLIADTNNKKFVSHVSFMEMAIKINIGKLPDFKIPLHDFITQTENDGFTILPLQSNHFTAYTLLPVIPDHKDPFDRLLITIAMQENMSIITVDGKFKAYNHLVNIL